MSDQQHVLYLGRDQVHVFTVAPYGVTGTELYHLTAECECGLTARTTRGMAGILEGLKKAHKRKLGWH